MIAFETVSLIDTAGAPFQIARVPRIARRFRSPMHSPHAATLGLGPWTEQYEALVDGALPSALLFSREGDAKSSAAIRAAALEAAGDGFDLALQTGPHGATRARLCRPGAIADELDLDALEHDVAGWLSAVGQLESCEEQLRESIATLREAAWSDYLLVESIGAWSGLAPGLEQAVFSGQDPAVCVAAHLATATQEPFYLHPAAEQPASPVRLLTPPATASADVTARPEGLAVDTLDGHLRVELAPSPWRPTVGQLNHVGIRLAVRDGALPATLELDIHDAVRLGSALTAMAGHAIGLSDPWPAGSPRPAYERVAPWWTQGRTD